LSQGVSRESFPPSVAIRINQRRRAAYRYLPWSAAAQRKHNRFRVISFQSNTFESSTVLRCQHLTHTVKARLHNLSLLWFCSCWQRRIPSCNLWRQISVGPVSRSLCKLSCHEWYWWCCGCWNGNLAVTLPTESPGRGSGKAIFEEVLVHQFSQAPFSRLRVGSLFSPVNRVK
jgi:hypothetical protein